MRKASRCPDRNTWRLRLKTKEFTADCPLPTWEEAVYARMLIHELIQEHINDPYRSGSSENYKDPIDPRRSVWFEKGHWVTWISTPSPDDDHTAKERGYPATCDKACSGPGKVGGHRWFAGKTLHHLPHTWIASVRDLVHGEPDLTSRKISVTKIYLERLLLESWLRDKPDPWKVLALRLIDPAEGLKVSNMFLFRRGNKKLLRRVDALSREKGEGSLEGSWIRDRHRFSEIMRKYTLGSK